jgi:hypothetical protein
MAKQPWEVPDPPENGDATHDVTFAAVGEALSKWEWFEGNLSLVFSCLLGTGYGNMAALRAYGSVESFRGRATLIEHAAEVHFKYKPSDALHGDLKNLLRMALNNFSGRRNEIAHGIVNPYITIENERAVRKGFVLYPAYYATRKRTLPQIGEPVMDTKANYVYSSVEIKKFAEEFGKLAETTIEILTRIIQHDQLVSY